MYHCGRIGRQVDGHRVLFLHERPCVMFMSNHNVLGRHAFDGLVSV